MKKLAIASALLSALAITGTANAYQAEIGASAAYVDQDNRSSGNTFGVDGTYYFNPVQPRNAPLAEAAYLDRASNIGAYATFEDHDNSDTNTFGANVEVFVPNSDFYVGAGVAQHEYEEKVGSLTFEDDLTTYHAELGYLPAPGLLIAAGVKGWDHDEDDGVDPTLRAKYVTTLSNGKDINLEAGAAFGDLDEYNLAADYYIDKTLSIGVDYYDNDLDDTNEFGINARKFFTPQVSLEGRVGFGEDSGVDNNSFGLAAKYRF